MRTIRFGLRTSAIATFVLASAASAQTVLSAKDAAARFGALEEVQDGVSHALQAMFDLAIAA